MPKKYKGSFIRNFIKKTEDKIKTKKYVEVKGRVNAGTLNIREKPSLKSKVLSQLKRSQLVDVFNEIGDWYQIVYKRNKSAFVFKKYIDIIREEKNGIITAKTLNVRNQPNTDCQILGKLHKGDIVNILHEYKDWIKINYSGSEAFLYKQYVDFTDVPIDLNPIVGSSTYFYERKDLATVDLAARKK